MAVAVMQCVLITAIRASRNLRSRHQLYGTHCPALPSCRYVVQIRDLCTGQLCMSVISVLVHSTGSYSLYRFAFSVRTGPPSLYVQVSNLLYVQVRDLYTGSRFRYRLLLFLLLKKGRQCKAERE